MPRTRASAACMGDVAEKEAEARMFFSEDEDNEGSGAHDEYEEVEEEVEDEEEDEEVDDEEEEVEEMEEMDDEEEEGSEENDGNKGSDGDEHIYADEAEREKHAELMSLPPHGSEVYVGGIPSDTSDDDLKEFCASVGEVVEVRIMKTKEGKENKGFAFVTFKTKELATSAIAKLNNSELKGKKVKCSKSQVKHRLFIGNVPRSWEREDMRKIVMKVGPGVTSVELLKDPKDSSQNRGFAFIEYYNHACAAYAKEKMSKPEFKLDDNAPTVSWADPKNSESSSVSQVKSVYIRNLPKNATQEQVKELFKRHGSITKVVLPAAKAGREDSRFGFVHFSERASAMKALKNTEKYEIDGHVLECSLAKPQADQKSSGGSNSQGRSLHSAPTPRVGYGGLMGGSYGVLGSGFGAPGFAQPLVYGQGVSPAGMAMMPMLLPDGRIGYVLQQPGVHQRTPTTQKGGKSGGSGGRRSSENRQGNSRYRPY